MKIATSAQMKNIDNRIIKSYKSSRELMENAARSVAAAILEEFTGRPLKKVAVVAGKGNNGGDGMLAAVFLTEKGLDVTVYLLSPEEELSSDAKVALGVLKGTRCEILPFQASVSFEDYDVIIDAILGIGFYGDLRPEYRGAVARINESRKYVVAVDIPTGVETDTGYTGEFAVRANLTITFSMYKPAHLIYPGREYCGKIVLTDIGIPREIMDEETICLYGFTEQEARYAIPRRRENSNKGTFGRLFIVAGSKGMAGAACMASKAAMKSGCGLCYLAVPDEILEVCSVKLDEEIVVPFKSNEAGTFEKSDAAEILEFANACDAVVFGPGIRVNKDTKAIFKTFLSKCERPIVIDADGINILAENINILKNRKCEVIVTPHPGEMARLTGMSVADVQKDRLKAALEIAREYNVTVVLKGAGTITALPDGRCFINTTGNPGMATAGSGDVLSGIMGSFLAQRLNKTLLSAAAVYIHGAAGDDAARKLSKYSMTATDIISSLPFVLKKYDPME